jgi:hypothetical protein
VAGRADRLRQETASVVSDLYQQQQLREPDHGPPVNPIMRPDLPTKQLHASPVKIVIPTASM